MSSLSRSDFLKIVAGGSLGAFFLGGCDDVLNQKPYSLEDPEKTLSTADGVTSVLASAYGNAQIMGKFFLNNLSEWPTGISWQTGGAENRSYQLFGNFNWDASLGGFNGWYNGYYKAIRDANTILDNKDKMKNIDADKVDQFAAEARFVRALSYQYLFKLFGPTPLRKSNNDDLDLPRASDEEMEKFIVSEYEAIASTLPDPGEAPQYGRATSGAAKGLLCKFSLNRKKWQKAADTSKEIINMNYYELYPNFLDMLKVSNEGNKEMLWVFARSAKANGDRNANLYMNGIFPPGFQKWPKTGLIMQNNWNNWASSYRLKDAFYHSFDSNDQRREPILVKYINGGGKSVNLLDNKDDTRSFRYWPDPNAQGNTHGNDIPAVRYADILLSRAEALNELQGPNSKSIDLINQVRSRAGMGDLQVSEFSSKKDLRLHLLSERSWEFYSEGKRREDLIRMDKFIEYAHDRGVSHADSHHRVYPLPQPAIDSNSNLEQEQNPGY
jgi:hypothetical protein